MNKIEFIKVVNEVVDYKLKKLIPEIEKRIMESFEKRMLSENTDKEDATQLAELMKSQAPIKTQPVQTAKVKKIRGIPIDEETGIPNMHFTRNPILNKILNETMVTPQKFQSPSAAMVSLMTEATGTDEQMEDVPTMNFNMRNMPTQPTRLPANIKSGNGIPNAAGAEELKQEIAAQSGDPDLANVMVKDYRDVLKKADEKAKRIRAGGI